MKRSTVAQGGKREKLGDSVVDAARAARWRARMHCRLPQLNPSETSPRNPPARCQKGLHLLRRSRDGSRLRAAGDRCSTTASLRRLLPPSGLGEGCARLRGRLPPPHLAPAAVLGHSRVVRVRGPPARGRTRPFPTPACPHSAVSSLPFRRPVATAQLARPGADTSFGGGRCAELCRAGGR